MVTATGAGILRAPQLRGLQRRGPAAAQDGQLSSGVGTLEKQLKDRVWRRSAPASGRRRPSDGAGHDGRFTWRDGVRSRDPGPVRTKGAVAVARRRCSRPARPVEPARGIGKGGTRRWSSSRPTAYRSRWPARSRPSPAAPLIHAAAISSDARLLAGSTSPSLSRAAAVGAPCPASTRAPSGAPTRAGATGRRATTTRSTGARPPHRQQQRLPPGEVPALIRGMYRYHTPTSAGPTSPTTSSSTASGDLDGRAGGTHGRPRRAHPRLQRHLDRRRVIGNFEQRQAHQPPGRARELAAWKLARTAATRRDGPRSGPRAATGSPRHGSRSRHRRTPRHQRDRLPGRHLYVQIGACERRPGVNHGGDAEAEEAVHREGPRRSSVTRSRSATASRSRLRSHDLPVGA